MNGITILVIFLNFQTYFCHEDLNQFFEYINKNTVEFNKIAAEIAWKSSINPGNPSIPQESAEYQRNRILWQHSTCQKMAALDDHLLNSIQRRMAFLLCRGPKFTLKEARYLHSLYDELQSRYSNFKICLTSENISKTNITELGTIINNLKPQNQILKDAVCINGEEDFQNIMAHSKNEEVLKWAWLTWREMTKNMKKSYGELVMIENVAARRNGYHDIGQAWREDLEVPNLRQLCRRLYNRAKPLYKLLHGIARYFLKQRYGDVVPERGPIPAHLFGNLWAQSWDSIIDSITPQSIDLDGTIKMRNWTVFHMVKRVEDFYQSLGLPAMPDSFWRESIFSRENDGMRCHGSAADMYNNGDYRLIYCSGTTMQDFYVLHHEMGHIQYFIAYEDQPGLFRQANAALHESIGDAIMYGVMTPQHLHRLGLVNDTILFDNAINGENDNAYQVTNKNAEENRSDISKDSEEANNYDDKNEAIIFESSDDIIMLKQALNKIPQIPFSLIIDEYRWKIFEGDIADGTENAVFWSMVEEFSGIGPPSKRGEEYFDVGAKFHVPDNTPYIRYFLSSFLQHQIFEALCKAAVFGRRNVDEDIPDTITLNRCDIYGSKAAGKLLKELMSQGHSKPWQQILSSSLGIEDISASSLLRYYRPLQKLLQRFVDKYNIPIGWFNFQNVDPRRKFARTNLPVKPPRDPTKKKNQELIIHW